MLFRSSFEVLNKYIKNLGVKNEDYEFVEVIGFDDDLLAFVPQPVSAVLLLFPITEEVPVTDCCRSIDPCSFSTKHIDRKN